MSNFNALDAIRQGWTLTKKHFIITLGLVLAFMVLSWLISLLGSGGSLISLVFNLLSLVVSIVFSMGMIRITVDAVDGEEPTFEAFKTVMPRFWNFLGVSVVVGIIELLSFVLIAGVGVAITGGSFDTGSLMNDPGSLLSGIGVSVLLGAIPAIYLAIRLFFAPFLVVDRNMGVIESIKKSWEVSRALQGQIFVFMLLCLVSMIIGLVCLIVGVFVSMITIYYGQAALYRMAFTPATPDVLLVNDATMQEVAD